MAERLNGYILYQNFSMNGLFKEAFLRLRPVNLLIIAIFLYFFQHFIIIPIFQTASAIPGLNAVSYRFFLMAILLIAAGGNLFNDYTDYSLDQQYKPQRGHNLSSQTLFWSSIVLLMIGTITGVGICRYLGAHSLSFIFILSAIGLVLYSLLLKSTPLIGNIVIASLCALPVILLVNLNYTGFERNTLHAVSAETEQKIRMLIRLQLIGYAGFAFWITLIREITKDMEDEAGDREYGHKTLAVTLGLNATKYIASLLIVLAMVMMGWLQYYVFTPDLAPKQFWYILFSIQFSLLITLFSTFPVMRPKEIAFTNLFLKLVMLQGILAIPLFHHWSKSV